MIRRSFGLMFLSALCVFSLVGCYHTYYADPITATVVDSDTKRPIEGAVVVAHWEMKGGLEGGNVGGEVMIMEAVTDNAGRFHFPAWGPKKVYVGLSNAHLTNDTPEMILFKSGYKWGLVANASTRENIYGVGPHVSSDWNGKTIQMQKFNGALDEYARYLGDLFPDYAFSRNCAWREIPEMVTGLAKQTRIFRAEKISSGNFYTHIANNEGSCGSVDELVREHGG